MYIYNIGSFSYEESEYIQLYHKDKFTRKEFEEIVMKSTAKIVEKEGGKNVSFEHILSDVVEDLIKNHGFTQVKFDAEFSVFGEANILGKNDLDEGEQGELLEKLRNFIKNKPNSAEK